MPSQAEIEEELWKALKSDRTVMLGLVGGEGGHSRPMTVHLEEPRGPLWIFTSTENALVREGAEGEPAFMTFASKGHDVWASLTGTLFISNDQATIERLWNPFVAAWYEGGKTDPKLVLLRFEADHAEIWIDANSMVAGIKMLLGMDPKKDYRDKVAEVDL